jgi:hypothetical protein
MKSHISNFIINQEYISVFASGNSILDIPIEEIKKIKEQSFTIFINYAPARFKEEYMNMLIFSDRKVSEWLNKEYIVNKRKKETLWLSRHNAFTGNKPYDIFDMSDYHFNNSKENLNGNYTIVWLLQILQKYFKNKKILLFGLDMYTKDNNKAKYYDSHTNWDYNKRGKNYAVKQKLDQCGEQLNKYIINKDIYNCNINSHYNTFIKKDWKDILKWDIE